MHGRERLMFSGSGYLLLAASAALALATPVYPTRGGTALLCGLVLAAAGWLCWTLPGKPRNPLLYQVVLVALITALTWLNPWFGLFGAIGYAHAFGLLPPKWIAVSVGTQAVLTTLAQQPEPSTTWGLVLNATVPLLYAGVMIGNESEKRRRTNAELAAALAENTGLHAQLLAQAREAGITEERQRLAREIHDTLAQGLAGIITQLQAEEQTADRKHLATAARLARQSLTEARRSVRALRPERLADSRLPEAVRELAGTWSADSGVPAEVRTEGTARPVPNEVEVALYRVTQEALTNVAKHARASRVVVTLSYLDDQVVVDVRDDGIGFACDAAHAGFGLTVMRQRTAEVGGRLSVESDEGGTAVSASVPGGADD